MLKKLWYKLLGYNREKIVTEVSSLSSYQPKSNLKNDYEQTTNLSTIKDKDLEFLFNQLLEGVINGWQENRVEQFFQKLEHRVTMDEWFNWLKRFEKKLMASSASNYQLAAKMILLGDVTSSLPFVSRIGELASNIGEKLLNKNSDNSVVESLRSNVLEQIAHHEEGINDTSVLLTDNFSSFNIIESSPDNEDVALEIEERETKTENNHTSSLNDEDYSPDLQLMFKIGLEKAQGGDLKGAIACWDRILEEDDTFAQAWHNRGSALAYLNRLEESIFSFDRAISLNVNDYQSWNDRGNVMYNLQRWEEALISWDRVISIKPDDYQAWYNRGLALEKLNLLPEAMSSYEQALEIEPNFELAHNRQQKLLALLPNVSK